MSWSLATYVLTVLAAIVVIVTRLRLTGGEGLRVSHGLVRAHTAIGGLGVVLWSIFLIAGDGGFPGRDLIGLIGLGCFWVTALIGLVLLARWLPARGKHSSAGGARRSGWGFALSLLGHLGLAVGAAVFTWAYLTSAV